MDRCVPGVEASSILGGTAMSPYVGVDWQGTLLPLIDVAGAVTCSAIAVTDSLLLTAGHCVPTVVGAALQGAVQPVEVVALLEGIDLAIVRGDFASSLRPIRLSSDVSAVVREGDLLELAGFGWSENAPSHAPNFAVVTVEEVSGELLATSADGYAGACFGDSGGALLTRGEDGLPVAVGVIIVGARDCAGRDESLRSDLILEQAGALFDFNQVIDPGCGGIPPHGRCFGQLAVRCEAGVSRAERCSDDRRCGWAVDSGQYRCVSPNNDPCGGISEFGVCTGTSAESCLGGKLGGGNCQECGAVCVRSPRSGKVGCALQEL